MVSMLFAVQMLLNILILFSGLNRKKYVLFTINQVFSAFAIAILVFIFLSFSFLSHFWTGCQKLFKLISLSISCRHVKPRSGVTYWTRRQIRIYVLKFRVWENGMPWALLVKVMADLSKGMWDIALQPLETYFYYHNDYGHHTWQGSDLPWGAPTHKISWPFNHVVLQNHLTI